MMLRYKRINSQFFTDTFFGKSTRGNTCAQLFVSDKGFVAIYPMKSKADYPQALHLFLKEVGVPHTLLVDPSGEQTSKEAKKLCNQVGTTLKVLEESTQWANRAELYIGLLKSSILKDLSHTHAPMKLWDYCAERRVRIHNVIPRDLFQLNGNTPITATFGTEGDISNICQFDWYDWCYFREEGGILFPNQKRQLGRVLGPIKNEGNEMIQGVLTITGKVKPRRTCNRLTTAEWHNPSEIQKRKQFDEAIRKIYGDSTTLPPVTKQPLDTSFADLVKESEDDDDNEIFDPNDILDGPTRMLDEDPVDRDGKAPYEKPLHDLFISAEVLLPQGEEMQAAKVKSISKDILGNEIGSYDPNLLLNLILYEVEFPDGQIKQYLANVIAKNMFSQVDEEGHSTALLESIVDYKRDRSAVPMNQKYVYTKSGQRRPRKSNAGWKLLVQFKDGYEQWIPLKVLKESNPIEVAEFAKARGIDDEPAFHWWVTYTLRERDRIISAVNSRARSTRHKYGIEVPATIEEAQALDRKNGNTLWIDAIHLEMSNVKIAFEILDEDDPLPIGWTQSSGHLVFDVKMDFTRKARWVKDGHKTPKPEHSTYAGVVSRESVRIALTYAALDELNVCAADIKNTYLQAPSLEKHYIICGLEFGIENKGKRELIRRALYGGKSSGADFWKYLRDCMNHLKFKSCKGDPDVWMREAVKDDGTEYWEYILLYVDDALCKSVNTENTLRSEIGRFFYLKKGSVGPPKINLGDKVSKVTLDNGVDAWSFSSSQYVQNAVANIEDHLHKQGKKLPKRVKSALASPELGPSDAAYYQSLIGILQWINELGRVDITCEASLMASSMALPREGHLEQLYHIFAYLKLKHNLEMVFDPSEPDIDPALFPKEDWGDMVYGECKEE